MSAIDTSTLRIVGAAFAAEVADVVTALEVDEAAGSLPQLSLTVDAPATADPARRSPEGEADGTDRHHER